MPPRRGAPKTSSRRRCSRDVATCSTDLDLVFFDTTSLFFTGDGGETLGQYGKSKDRRSDCKLMVLGMVIDGDGIPVCSEIWPGSTTGVTTLDRVAERLQSRFGVRRVCLVGDAGMMSNKQIAAVEARGWLYILGARLRRTKEVPRDVLGIALEQFVYLYPQCLFPVDITRKFGVNPPAGMYFHEFSFVPLRAVLGEDAIAARRARLKDREIVEAGMQFYESRPDLTRDEILATWDDEDGSEGAGDEPDDPVALWLRAKVRNRVVSMVLTYSDPVSPHW